MDDFESTCGLYEAPDDDRSRSKKPAEVCSDNTTNEIQSVLEPVVIDIKRYDGPRNEKNEPCGFGTAKLTNGDSYKGTFRKGLFHGNGVLKQRTGHRYEGFYRKGLRNGRGTQTYPDRSSYCGDWRKGIRHGYGVYRYTNKDCYEGNWCGDKKHGIGTYTFAENGIRLRGSWAAGTLTGPIEILLGDIRYHGTWHEGSLSANVESVFNIASKYLLRGIMRRGPFDQYLWSPRTIERYSFANLPLEPLPVPIPMMVAPESDSSDDSSTDSLKCA